MKRSRTTNLPIDRTLGVSITVKELTESIGKLNDISPGPDGPKKEDVKRIPRRKLMLLFNIYLATMYSPRLLHLGSVTLVSKTAKPENPGQYRPITVTSMILRAYHSVIAKRLQRLPLSPRQKAFLPRNGIAENSWIIDQIIHGAKWECRELRLVFVDVVKAFDSLSHSSLIQACERIGIPSNLVEYFRVMYSEAEVRFK